MLRVFKAADAVDCDKDCNVGVTLFRQRLAAGNPVKFVRVPAFFSGKHQVLSIPLLPLLRLTCCGTMLQYFLLFIPLSFSYFCLLPLLSMLSFFVCDLHCPTRNRTKYHRWKDDHFVRKLLMCTLTTSRRPLTFERAPMYRFSDGEIIERKFALVTARVEF